MESEVESRSGETSQVACALLSVVLCWEFNICGNRKSFVLPSPIFKGDGTTANSVVSC